MIRTDSESELKMTILYKKGKTMKQIAEKFDVSTGTVCTHLKKYIPRDEKRKRQYRLKSNEYVKLKIKEMYTRGFSSLVIGKKLGISSSTVLYNLRKMGIDSSKKGKYKSKIDAKKLEKIKKSYIATGSVLKTGKEFGLHPSSIHYRLMKLGIVKKNALNQKIARKKYELFTYVLTKLFKKMGYEIRYVQRRYNGHGPDMIIENDLESILVEHKATVKRSWYWKHGIQEVKENISKYNTTRGIVITTAKKPKNFKETETKVIFFDDLERLLKEKNLQNLIPEIQYVSNTPSV